MSGRRMKRQRPAAARAASPATAFRHSRVPRLTPLLLSIKDPSKCELCDRSPLFYLLPVIIIAVLSILAFSYFIWLILRYPRARRTWVSTITIMINHAQTLAVLAGLRLDWPAFVRQAMAALSFDFLMLPSSICLFKAAGIGRCPFFGFTLY